MSTQTHTHTLETLVQLCEQIFQSPWSSPGKRKSLVASVYSRARSEASGFLLYPPSRVAAALTGHSPPPPLLPAQHQQPVPPSLQDKSRAPGLHPPLRPKFPEDDPSSRSPVPREKGSAWAKTAITTDHPSPVPGLLSVCEARPAQVFTLTCRPRQPPRQLPRPRRRQLPFPAAAPSCSGPAAAAATFPAAVSSRQPLPGQKQDPTSPRPGRRGGASRPRDPSRPGEELRFLVT